MSNFSKTRKLNFGFRNIIVGDGIIRKLGKRGIQNNRSTLVSFDNRSRLLIRAGSDPLNALTMGSYEEGKNEIENKRRKRQCKIF